MNDVCDLCGGWRQISHINRQGEYVCTHCAEDLEEDEEEDYDDELEDEEEATEDDGAR